MFQCRSHFGLRAICKGNVGKLPPLIVARRDQFFMERAVPSMWPRTGVMQRETAWARRQRPASGKEARKKWLPSFRPKPSKKASDASSEGSVPGSQKRDCQQNQEQKLKKTSDAKVSGRWHGKSSGGHELEKAGGIGHRQGHGIQAVCLDNWRRHFVPFGVVPIKTATALQNQVDSFQRP